MKILTDNPFLSTWSERYHKPLNWIPHQVSHIDLIKRGKIEGNVDGEEMNDRFGSERGEKIRYDRSRKWSMKMKQKCKE